MEQYYLGLMLGKVNLMWGAKRGVREYSYLGHIVSSNYC